MTAYNTNLEVFYCKQLETPGLEHRIAPAPMITVSPEIYYVNDNVVGYTYNISLRGYANALRREIDAGSTLSGLSGVADHIGDIRNIFNTNGGNLYIKQAGTNILVAKGATIKTISFDQSENRWFNYSPYTVNIEFNEVDFIGCTNNPVIACNSSFFHSPHQSGSDKISNKLVDITKYKIKTFNDKWSFTIDDQIYENYNNLYNNVFKISYSITATGKNYYVDDKLVPAWHQARSFAQNRLVTQVSGLIGGILQINNGSTTCDPVTTIQTLHSGDMTSPRESGMLQRSGFTTFKDKIAGQMPAYNIYNETITCDTSESEGTFSLTYNAIVKKTNPGTNGTDQELLENAALHSYTKDISVSESNNQNVTITVKGNIQGLIPGGFIDRVGDFYTLPASGQFIYSAQNTQDKYKSALAFFNKFVGSHTISYGQNGGLYADLSQQKKEELGVNYGQLLVKGDSDYTSFSPTSVVLDHGYTDGTIGYTFTYDKLNASTQGKGYTNITIDRKEPIEMVQEFVVPGRISGPIIQRLGMKSAKVVTININGASDTDKFVGTDLTDINICNYIPSFGAQVGGLLTEDHGVAILTKKDFTSNRIDGSYNLTLEYTYYQQS